MGGEAGCDPLDQASDIESEFRERAIKETQALVQESHPDFDGKHCIDCDMRIPAARLRLVKIRCVSCQTVLEQRSKFFR